MSDEREEQKRTRGLNRREWLMRLGETAILTGFSGLAGEAAAQGAEQAPTSPVNLPPGLYEPMSDHLGHALVTDERFHPVPPGSPTDFVQPKTGPYRSGLLSSEQFESLGRIVEVLLGEAPKMPAPTPGGQNEDPVTQEVAQWIDLVLSRAAGVRNAARNLSPEHKVLAIRYHDPEALERLEKEEPEKVCREGLAWLEGESAKLYGKPFRSLDEAEATELLKLAEDEYQNLPPGHSGALFFRWIKGKAIQGFYTSRAGLKELDYKGNSFYAECPGCSTKDS